MPRRGPQVPDSVLGRCQQGNVPCGRWPPCDDTSSGCASAGPLKPLNPNPTSNEIKTGAIPTTWCARRRACPAILR